MHACISGVFVELVDSTLLNWKNSKKEVFGLVWFAWMEHYWNLLMGSLCYGSGNGIALEEDGMITRS